MSNETKRISDLPDGDFQKAHEAIQEAREQLVDAREELENQLYNLGMDKEVAERLSYTRLQGVLKR